VHINKHFGSWDLFIQVYALRTSARGQTALQRRANNRPHAYPPLPDTLVTGLSVGVIELKQYVYILKEQVLGFHVVYSNP